MDDFILWRVRHFVYNHFADTTLPPSIEDTSRHFNISTEEAGDYYKELHKRHAFYLEPETTSVRMAWPFSAIPTDFKVQANGKTYYANCAWDMLGIPAALHTDAVIDAVCTESNESVQLEIKNGNIAPAAVPGGGESAQNGYAASSSLLVHFPLPFVRWYDDLVFT